MKNKLEQMVRHYLITALWASIDDNDEPLDSNYSLLDICYELQIQAENDCSEFLKQARIKLGDKLNGLDISTIGHDFWLTRNHHGAGFWDGDYSEDVGEALTELSHEFTETHLYVGDNEKICSI